MCRHHGYEGDKKTDRKCQSRHLGTFDHQPVQDKRINPDLIQHSRASAKKCYKTLHPVCRGDVYQCIFAAVGTDHGKKRQRHGKKRKSNRHKEKVDHIDRFMAVVAEQPHTGDDTQYKCHCKQNKCHIVQITLKTLSRCGLCKIVSVCFYPRFELRYSRKT